MTPLYWNIMTLYHEGITILHTMKNEIFKLKNCVEPFLRESMSKIYVISTHSRAQPSLLQPSLVAVSLLIRCPLAHTIHPSPTQTVSIVLSHSTSQPTHPSLSAYKKHAAPFNVENSLLPRLQ